MSKAHWWRQAAALSGVALAAMRAAPARSSDLPTAREVIQRHVAAIGGEAAVKAITSRYVWARYEYPARRLRGSLELYAARPNKRLLKIEYPDLGTEVTGFDGKIGWTSKPGEAARPVEGADLALLRDQSVFDFDLHPDSSFRSMTTVDSTDFQGHRCYRLRLVSITGRQWLEYYDIVTGLFVGNMFRQETEQGPITVVTVVSDYRPFDGVRLPTRLSIRAAYVERIVTVVRVRDNQVDASVFDAPPKLRGAVSSRLD
ncbi:MAG TPA: hypothetical protein VJN70_06585 [Gemmatimonadaceae bacterium]|nr:hypothetical protein [Gemmatimonadaceae bacterium]